jgi:hypothetical protein
MRLVVTDANVIIDLDAGGLLEEIFRLPEIEFCTPDVLYLEELAQHYGVLPGLGLRVLSQAAEAVEYVAQLRFRYLRPSTNDLFALAMARNLACALLSGDRALRTAAEIEGVEVHGTLWLVDRLLQARIVSLDRVVAAYDAMKRDGSRLPWDEVEAQIVRWRQPDNL